LNNKAWSFRRNGEI